MIENVGKRGIEKLSVIEEILAEGLLEEVWRRIAKKRKATIQSRP